MDEPKPPKSTNHLWELAKHVFIAVSVFMLFAIPAIALDLFNQGVELIEFQRTATGAAQSSSASSSHQPPPVDAPCGKAQEPVKVSQPVRVVLHWVDYFILGVDTVFVVGYLLNGLWKFLRSLTWG